MNTPEIRPFDQGRDSQRAQFEAMKASKDWVNSAAASYAATIRRRDEQQIPLNFFSPYASIVEMSFFPGLVEPEKLKHYVSNPDLSRAIAEGINADPSLVLRFGEISADPSLEQSRELSKLFGVQEDLTQYDMRRVAEVGRYFKRNFDEFLYYRFVIEQARGAIVAIAPSLAATADAVIANTLLMHQPSALMNKADNFSQIKVNDMHFIMVEKVAGDQELDNNHSFRVAAVGHELLHCVSHELLGKPSWKFVAHGTVELSQSNETEEFRVGNLATTLEEGINLAFEYDFFKRVQSHTEGIRSSKLYRFAESRPRGLKSKNRLLFKEAEREMQVSDGIVEDSDIANFNELNYSEGARLAITLKRQGWTLNDLPVLTELIKAVVAEEMGSYEAAMLLQIPISRKKGSDYDRIMQRLRKLKKVA